MVHLLNNWGWFYYGIYSSKISLPLKFLSVVLTHLVPWSSTKFMEIGGFVWDEYIKVIYRIYYYPLLVSFKGVCFIEFFDNISSGFYRCCWVDWRLFDLWMTAKDQFKTFLLFFNQHFIHCSKCLYNILFLKLECMWNWILEYTFTQFGFSIAPHILQSL